MGKAVVRRLAIALLVVLSLVWTAGAWAQGGTGELTGIVFDPTGAVIAKATVTLTNDATGAKRATETTAAGVYRFAALPIVGAYTISVVTPGFGEYTAAGLVISVGTTMTHDVHLKVGSSKEVVNVEAGGETVQTTESQISQLVDQRVWQNMPLNVRNQNAFINLVAGAVPDEMAGSTRGAAVNGARGGAGNYLVEGLDNNDQGQGGRGQLGDDPGGAVTSISPDSIQEYRVITNSFAAEYGKAGGFVTDTVLKSGTNRFHGSLFEYNRVQALASNGWFSNRSKDVFGNPMKDRLVRNQFGGTFGGPVIKDRTFFFMGTELNRRRTAGSVHAIGTTQAFLDWVKSGNLEKWAESDPNGVCMQNIGKACPGALSHSNTLGPIFQKMLALQKFPLAPNTPCSGATASNCIGQGFWTSDLQYPVPVYGDVFASDPSMLNEYRISTKFDHRFSDKDNFSAVFLLQDDESGDQWSGGNSTIGPPSVNQGRSTNLGLTWNHTFTPSILNSFKASFLRHVSNFPPPSKEFETMPGFYTYYDSLDVNLGLYAGLPQYFTDNQFQYQDHLSITHGRHTFKLGGEFRRTRNGSSFFNDTQGTFAPYGIEDEVTDLFFSDEAELPILGKHKYGSVYVTSAAVDPTTLKAPEVYRGFRANEFAWYFQDDWRIHPRFTVNVGLRYEYFGPPHNFKPGIDSNVYFGAPITPIATTSTNVWFPSNNPFYAKVATATAQVRNNEIWNKDTNNFGPRFGFSWDMLGNQKLVMRAGAGIMFDRIYNNVFENIRFNPPFYSDNQIGYYANGVAAGALSTPGLLTFPFTSTAMYASKGLAPKPNPRHMDQNMVSPYYEQFHFGFQWNFAKDYIFEPEYISTLGHKLIGYYDINTFNGRVAPNQTTTRPNPNIAADNYRNNGFSSNYHGLQLALRKTYSNGLSFNSSYTWSKALDYLSDLFNYRGNAVTDVSRPQYDYGPADFNMKHRFVTSLSYDLPFWKQNKLLGGWGVNTILSLQSGVPFTPYSSASSYDANKDGRATDRVVPKGVNPMSTLFSGKNPADGYVDPAQWTTYACPASVNNGVWCDVPIGRGAMVGPGYANVDLGATKKFKINERAGFTFAANAFNLFNHANFRLPASNLNNKTTFGKSTATFGQRQVQLALRFDF